MQAPDWNDYQAFLAVARGGQLSRAAATMGVDATTIGRRLRRLEARLGATLFELTREGQVLTEAGEALLTEVDAMAQSAGRIAEQAGGEGAQGLLRISLTEGLAGTIVTPALTRA
jgi:DNA-binding transcriptional LysR family regulator